VGVEVESLFNGTAGRDSLYACLQDCGHGCARGWKVDAIRELLVVSTTADFLIDHV
jgi:hypothetical protein